MARKSKARTTGPDVRVKMIAPHSYRLDACSKRNLPKGWSGLVPTAIADEIEAAGTGVRDEAFEVADSKDTGRKVASNAKTAASPDSGATDPAATGAGANTTTDAGAGAAPASGGEEGAGQDGTTDLLGQGGSGGN